MNYLKAFALPDPMKMSALTRTKRQQRIKNWQCCLEDICSGLWRYNLLQCLMFNVVDQIPFFMMDFWVSWQHISEALSLKLKAFITFYDLYWQPKHINNTVHCLVLPSHWATSISWRVPQTWRWHQATSSILLQDHTSNCDEIFQ